MLNVRQFSAVLASSICRTLFIFIIVCSVLACKNPSTQSSTTSQSDLYTEVIKIHDEVMPKMSTIHRLKKMIKDTLPKLENTSQKQFSQHLEDLNIADDAMMSWMAEFRVPDNEEDKKKYLLAEKEKISKVRDIMLSSIEKAERLLKP